MKIIKFEASVSWRKIKILAKRIMNSRIILFYSMMVAIAEKNKFQKFDQFQTANINRKIVPDHGIFFPFRYFS